MKIKNTYKLLITFVLTSSLIAGCASVAQVEAPVEVVKEEVVIEEPLLDSYNESEYRYIKAETQIYEEASNESKLVGNLIKFATIELKEEIVNDKGENWSRINYVIINEFIEAWVPSENVGFKIGEDFRFDYDELEYTPKYKTKGYKDNPRIKAKAIYVSLNSVASNLDKFIDIANETEVNAFVIDVKDDNGRLLFEVEEAEKFVPQINDRIVIKDIEKVMTKLKENNIYAIARIVSFKDPTYSSVYPEKAITILSTGQRHTDRDGLEWGSPHDRQLWEYDVTIGKAAAAAGFNEIQFDYVRFPALTKAQKTARDFKNELGEEQGETIQNFLKYAYKELSKEEVYVAADVYGQVGSTPNGMGIGQYWEAISNEIDYIAPMMYPSHYGKGVYGLSVPDQFPYETILYGNIDNIERNKNIATPAVIRPWIQDFTATWVEGYIRYNEKELLDQIRALEELGIEDYMLWNSSNNYHTDALK